MKAKNTSSAKKIEIEFLYLDLDRCTRCRATDANLETAIRTVQSVLEASATIINVRKALATFDEAQQILSNRTIVKTNEELLDDLKKLLAETGPQNV